MQVEVVVMGAFNKIPVCFDPRGVAPRVSFSPSSAKPAPVVRSWEARFPVDVQSYRPLERDEIAVAHGRSYVDAVLNCERPNGFGEKSPEVAVSLPWTAGSMYAAAREAIYNGRCAVSPTSGFHHAGYEHGGSFCTFNGLMITAALLIDRHQATGVGILDCDQHYGNGTDEIIERLGLKALVPHYTMGGERWTRKNADEFLERLPEIIEEMGPIDVLLYQAGADPHVMDPLGGFLTTEQLYQRDKVVFETCARLGIPVAWNLAGGYRTREGAEGDEFFRPVINIHDNTMQACCETFLGLEHQEIAGAGEMSATWMRPSRQERRSKSRKATKQSKAMRRRAREQEELLEAVLAAKRRGKLVKPVRRAQGELI